MRLSFVIALTLCFIGLVSSSHAWDISDKQAYLEKMDILKSIMGEAATKPDNLREVCLIMSIGSDVNARYLSYNESDTEEQQRGELMAEQLSTCLAGLYLLDNQPD